MFFDRSKKNAAINSRRLVKDVLITKGLDFIESCLSDIKRGRFVIIWDGENEKEGDLFIPASMVTPQKINFMITHGRGIPCVTITENIAKRLKIKPIIKSNDIFHPSCSNMVDAVNNPFSPVSAFGRANTIKVMVDDSSNCNSIITPGHVLPIIARKNGLRERCGHTEASVDLAKLAECGEAGVLCEVLNRSGLTANHIDLLSFSKKFNIKILSISDIVYYQQNQCNQSNNA